MKKYLKIAGDAVIVLFASVLVMAFLLVLGFAALAVIGALAVAFVPLAAFSKTIEIATDLAKAKGY